MGRGLRLLLSCLWVVGLAACAGGEPEPPDEFYRLIVEAPQALARPALTGTLLVKRFSADGLLSQRPVVYARSQHPQALYQYNFHFWADTPTVMVQELVARVLRKVRVAEQVVMPAHGVPATHVLVGRIERLEHLVGDAPSVIVALELGVFHAGRRELVWLRSYAEELPVGARGVGPAAAAMNEALSKILSRFVADLAML